MERENNKENDSEFKVENSETDTQESSEENSESRIGKPTEFRDSTPEEKTQSQEQLVQNIQQRIEEMKGDLEIAEQGFVLQKEIEDKTREADIKEQEEIAMVREQLKAEGDPNPNQEALQAEITKLRDEAQAAKEKFHETIPADIRGSDIYTHKERLKADIAKEEDILQSNIDELEQLRAGKDE